MLVNRLRRWPYCKQIGGGGSMYYFSRAMAETGFKRETSQKRWKSIILKMSTHDLYSISMISMFRVDRIYDYNNAQWATLAEGNTK